MLRTTTIWHNCSSNFLVCVCLWVIEPYQFSSPAAAQSNKKADFEGLRVHALLTDLRQFDFYSYDPVSNKLCIDTSMTVGEPREVRLSDMIEGMHVQFCGFS